jgi:hypothetical protein
MKVIITTLCLVALNSFAANLFDEITIVDGFETNYSISSKSHDYRINLECQSFFNKFDIYNKDELISERYITRKECEVLETKTRICLKEKKQVCFNDVDIYEAKCNCN